MLHRTLDFDGFFGMGGLRVDEVTRGWIKLHNEELLLLFTRYF
jgi:hypothetical protein